MPGEGTASRRSVDVGADGTSSEASTRRPLLPFLTYLLAFYAVWIAWVYVVYPRMLTLGETTLVLFAR